jgi:hypothetical protein
MIRKSVAEILENHVTFELEAIDRMYLNAYVPALQTGGGFVYFVKTPLGATVPSTTVVAPLSERFVQTIERFVATEGLDLVTFEKGQRKDDVAQEYRARFAPDEGLLFVGKAQEKANVFRTEKRRDTRGQTYPWIIRSTAMPNHYYFYIVDRDFGPLFIKFCSYFPYSAKLCLNGHEWLKRQLTQRGIPFEPLDNGIRSTAAARRVQRIADTLTADKIDAVFRKWLRRLPHPFTAAHRQAGDRYHLSTRVLTEGVVPALHVDYKKSKVKQYHKEGQALRTETTINDTYDFAIGRALRNLPALREIGFAANRRMLHVESLSHDCLIGEDALDAVSHPVVVADQRAAGLRFADRRVLALMQTLCLFALSPVGFRHGDVRSAVAQLLGREAESYTASQMTYDLRRLRLHGLIERVRRRAIGTASLTAARGSP